MWAVGNNLNRAYDYFQDFCKCLSIFNKATNLQKNRKIEIKEEQETYLAAAHLAGPALCWPAPASCFSLARQAQRRRRRARARHGVSCLPPARPRHLGELHIAALTPWTSHSPPASLPRSPEAMADTAAAVLPP